MPPQNALAIADTGQAVRRVLANAGVLLGGRAANAVMGLGAIALAARSLGVAGFGVLVLIHALAQFMGETVKFQSWQTVLRYGAGPLADGRVRAFQRVIRFTLMLDALGALVGVGVGLAAVVLLGERLSLTPEHRPMAALYLTTVAFMVSATPVGLLRLLDRFDVLARQTALIGLVRLTGGAIAFFLHAPLPVFMLVWGMGTAAGFSLLAFESWRELRKRALLAGFPWRGPWSAGMYGVWRFAWSTNLSATLDVAFTHIITLAVGVVAGPAPAALWRVGRQVADAIAKPARLLTASLYPELAQLNARSGEGAAIDMWRLALRIAALAGALGLVLLILSLGAGAWLLRTVMGAGFEAAAGLMNWQVLAAVIGLLALPFEPMLVSMGRAGTALIVRAVVCAVYLALLWPMIAAFGASGAAVALVLASVALGLGMFAAVLRLGVRRAPSTSSPAVDTAVGASPTQESLP